MAFGTIFAPNKMSACVANEAASNFWRSCGPAHEQIEHRSQEYLANRVVHATEEALQYILSFSGEHDALVTCDYFAALIFSRASNEFIMCVEAMIEGSLIEAHASFVNGGGSCLGPNSSKGFVSFWSNIHKLRWRHFFDESMHSVFHRGIERCVFSLCSAKYDSPMTEILNRWKVAVLLPWLQILEGGNHEGNRAHVRSIDSLIHLANLVVDENFVRARVQEFYDIIADFPESMCAVAELRDTLSRTQQHQLLARSLRSTLQRRLLHSGASSSQIIDVYISTIKVLRVIDPRDILLNVVARPVRLYLQRRKDTVRCIVANLTDECSGELYEELHRIDAPRVDYIGDSEDEHAEPGVDWVPRSNKSLVSNSSWIGDILSMLISIYGSKEIFVNEYRFMLADKLIARGSHETSRELKNLELLKFRFGDSSLHHCEIMLRDVEESKRLNKQVSDDFLQITVVSQVFWPPLSDDPLTVHPRAAVFSRTCVYNMSFLQASGRYASVICTHVQCLKSTSQARLEAAGWYSSTRARISQWTKEVL